MHMEQQITLSEDRLADHDIQCILMQGDNVQWTINFGLLWLFFCS